MFGSLHPFGIGYYCKFTIKDYKQDIMYRNRTKTSIRATQTISDHQPPPLAECGRKLNHLIEQMRVNN